MNSISTCVAWTSLFCTLFPLPIDLIAKEGGSQTYKLLIPEIEFPSSYDPLDADNANNMDHIKLRYFSPIEIDEKDRFTSSVLESFDYEAKSMTMTWRVKRGLKYADGSALTPSDIVMAIKRMARVRSEFPVLSSIAGLREWSTNKTHLYRDIPGIRVDGDIIRITFFRNVPNPFFHFSLSLFAIQPSKCFDLKSSKSTCKVPPASGYYDFLDENPTLSAKPGNTKPINFVLRHGVRKSGAFVLPPKITLEYYGKELPELVKSLDNKSVIRTINSSDEFINQFRSEVFIQRLPRTAIWYLMLDPTQKVFEDKTCRRIFANTYRKLYGPRVKGLRIATKSFSSPIMPGYLTNEQIEKLVPTSYNDPKCVDLFKRYPVKFQATFPFWTNLLKDTMKELDMPTTGIVEGIPPSPDFAKAFVSGESVLLNALVSFWPIDLPSGFTMFFTPNMHPHMIHLLKDGELTKLSNQLSVESDKAKAEQLFEKIYVTLYEDAQLNALSYLGMAYISKDSYINRMPISTSEPNPWHLFSVK